MDWLRRAAEWRPGAPAVVTPSRSVTYAELDLAADGVASMVSASGLGEAVAMWGDRTVETVAMLWGVMRAGATAVVVDPRWPPGEQQRLTRAAGARGLLTAPDGGIDRLAGRRRGPPGAWGPPSAAARMVAFTSGTEGDRIGVVLTGSNVAASVAGMQRRLGNGPSDHWLCVLPLSHVGGLAVLWRQAEQGAPVVLEERFDAGRVAELMGTVSLASLVPVMLRRALDAGVAPGAKVLVGGAPVPETLLRRALEAGVTPLETYGMTETASAVCAVSPGRVRDELGTSGRPLAGVEVRVIAGGEAGQGREGRIEVRGAMVSPGRVGRRHRDPDRWLTTGDVGMVDSGGRLRVLGRADSMIVTGGENVHPAAVAAVLEAHPGVAGARVFGEPDEEWGNRVVAEVVLDGCDAADVLSWATERLHPAQVPRDLRVVESLPGKLEG